MTTAAAFEREHKEAMALRALRIKASLATADARAFVLELLHSPDFCALGAVAGSEAQALERNGQTKVGLRLLDALKQAAPDLVRQMYLEGIEKGIFP